MMQRTFKLTALASTLVLAACASTQGPGTGSTGTVTPAPAVERIAAPVAVPAPSARKVVLTMTGPKNVVEARDWPAFQREWRDTFADHAKDAGIQFTFADSVPTPTDADGTVLQVYVADYRLVGIGSRVFFGAMTGNAYIDAQVRFRSLRDGRSFGEQQYNTSSSAIAGVFAKVTPQQVDAIAANVFLDLKAAK